jgi:hypothetical protein
LVTVIFVAALLALAAVPLTAQAQLPAALYRCTVYENGALAGAGKTVDAYVGTEVSSRASAVTSASSVAILEVPVTLADFDPAKAISFKVNGALATETPDVDVTMAAPEVRLDIITDPCNPRTVTNLAVTGQDSDSIDLSWTAPGEDPNGTGTCTSYYIRYALSQISTPADWVAAVDATGEPAPSAPGTPESFTVNGLSPGTTYWFALKAEDDVGKLSDISNSPSGTTRMPGMSLPEGWNIVSTPVTLESFGGANRFGNIIPTGVLAAYRLYGNNWYAVTSYYVLKPLEGIAVNVDTGGTELYFVPEDGLSAPPTRALYTGWSLIGPAPAWVASFPDMSVLQVLGCMDGSYSNVVSPALNQPGWMYGPNFMTVPNMLPYKGYFVYMEAYDTLVGFSSTPLAQ